MKSNPPRWEKSQLEEAAGVSANNFRVERLSQTGAWQQHYKDAKKKFEALFVALGDLDPSNFTDESLAKVFKGKLGEALRYLAGPPISDDDLKVLADVSSLAPGVLANDREALRKVFSIIERVIDPHRFPWVLAKRAPTEAEKSAALLASSVLLAAQRLATERRNDGKTQQETQVKDYLRSLGFKEVPTATIDDVIAGPQALEFCAECLLGSRKADVVLRLHDKRLMAIECKVSNSATNSVKRLNNDAAAKATEWIKDLGITHVVPTAVLSGVFNTRNLIQAQDRGLAIFWAHDLDQLGLFIESTR